MSGFFYRLLIGAGQTTLGYKEALMRCEPGWKLVDIGTGDGYALLRNADLIKQNNFKIDCFEPDRDAAELLQKDVAKLGLENQIEVVVEPLEYATTPAYDACLCITTLICFPGEKRRECVEKCLSHVKPAGKLLVHQSLYTGLDRIFLIGRYITSYTVYFLYKPLFVNDLKGIFGGMLWDIEQIHWMAPFMLFTVHKPATANNGKVQ